MSDTKAARFTLELITNLYERTRSGTGNDGQLMQLRRSVRLAGDPGIWQCMDELARKKATLKPGDPRWTEIVEEILRLTDVLK